MTKIVFVCTGNTCRSPMAEAILKSKNITGIEVKSAGIFASDGADASSHAKKVLQENEITHIHQSSMLNQEMLDWANIILTMTNSHKNYIIQQYPETNAKVYTIKEFVENDQGDVFDPYGGSLQNYRQTFNELQQLIDKLIIKLTADHT
ncbi:low molecular weight protein arginine phosphatase [Caldibacillus lycopersici]|uniref:Low molecular weight protein arginine phosphatase n=1 Tax=Perspicuibacillus lycopersici TaxID=1325689 RepID=A0AAE3ITS7_9BACI|nr:low molecular weight protein arginine phosphatase [Perspicuibacillus lycopersici]MCU9613309.1 low molecular weight protein arginine phosphatase [Perspicuibacillus lycopersici]